MQKFFVTIAIIGAAIVATPSAQSKLTLKVHTGKGQTGYDVNSTMVMGEKEMIVIDPQFSLSEAHKLAAEILESKKTLTTIYSTHAHPDHLFGVAVLKQAFPDAKYVALPAVVAAASPTPRRARARGRECCCRKSRTRTSDAPASRFSPQRRRRGARRTWRRETPASVRRRRRGDPDVRASSRSS